MADLDRANEVTSIVPSAKICCRTARNRSRLIY